jgi:hypothetical protein
LKKLAFSLIALAAMSAASFAWDKNYDQNRNYDLRDSSSYNGRILKKKPAAYNADAPFAVNGDRPLTSFERTKLIMEQNEHGRHD